ncbi:MAG: outer membrane lipoprotein carrier protein LolA [Alphaproteobacteria bacterium]|nr:outer membrane lipoprotein carrier protein LolA [Alphaproteobacteria bacterium]
MTLKTALTVLVFGAVVVAQAAFAKENKSDTGTSGSGWSAEVAKRGTSGLVLSERQTELVKQVASYFNSLGDLKGKFIQYAKGKRPMRGNFLMQRPGKFRFNYNKPSRQVIISDGRFLAIQDYDLNNEDRVELDQTPFRLLLRKNVDLLRDALITGVKESDDQVVLGLRDKNSATPGHIKLTFSRKPDFELEEWLTKDAQGQDTRVVIGNLVKDEKIDARMFKIKPVGLMQHP